MQRVGHIHPAAQDTEQGIVADRMLFVAEKHHADAGENQEGREDIENPRILCDQSRAKSDHDAAQHDHAKDAPEQHTVLINARNGKIGEDQRNDEDIVQRQRLLDHKGRQVSCGRLGAQLPPDKAGKGDSEADVERRKFQAFSHADLVVGFVQKTKVKHQKGDDNGNEGQPHPQWRSQKKCRQQFHP